MRAADWDLGKRDASYTLRGRDLAFFEEWVAKSPDREPKPIALQTEYLLASRRTVTRRQRTLAAAVSIGLSVAVGLGTIAYFQNRERERQQTIAEARQLVNRASALRDGPLDEPGTLGRLDASTRAAASALATFDRLEVPTLEADEAVRKSYTALPKWSEISLHPEKIDASAFDIAGSHVAVLSGGKRLALWDTASLQMNAACPLSLAAMESVLALATSEHGGLAATAIYDATQGSTVPW